MLYETIYHNIKQINILNEILYGDIKNLDPNLKTNENWENGKRNIKRENNFIDDYKILLNLFSINKLDLDIDQEIEYHGGDSFILKNHIKNNIDKDYIIHLNIVFNKQNIKILITHEYISILDNIKVVIFDNMITILQIILDFYHTKINNFLYFLSCKE